MKIGGPKGPGQMPPVMPNEQAKPAGGAEVETFGKVLDPSKASPSAPSSSIGAAAAQNKDISPVQRAAKAIVERVQAGELSRQEAADALIAAVVQHRGAAVPAQARQQLEAVLKQMLDEDPILSAKVRQLGSK